MASTSRSVEGPSHHTVRVLQLFETSIRLQPESSASKWLYLGQLQEGLEAKQSFSKGAELLLAELKKREKVSTSTNCS